MKRISFFIACLIIAGNLFAADSVQTLQNGMKVTPKNGAAKTIEINVINSRIVRVFKLHLKALYQTYPVYA